MENQIITGKTKLTGILGNPVSHSVSPAIHNHLFRKLDLPYVYVPLGSEKSGLKDVVASLRALKAGGGNVTIPYKSEVVAYCDEVSKLSILTGTVNTLYFKDATLCGTTTDFKGFSEAVISEGGEINKAHIVILGNGGTARTIAIALAHEKNIESLSILGRSEEKVTALAKEVNDKTGFAVTTALFNSDGAKRILKTCTLLVNCTSVGMTPHVDSSPLDKNLLHEGMFVFDAIYNPVETKLLKEAREKGCKAVNGLPMLLFQGLASFEYWTGVKPPRDLISIDELTDIVLKGK